MQIEFYDFNKLYDKLAKAKVGMFFRGTSAEISIDEIRGYLEKTWINNEWFCEIHSRRSGENKKEIIARKLD